MALEEVERALDEIALVLQDVLGAEDAEAIGLPEAHNRLQEMARKRLRKVLFQRGLITGSVQHLTEG